MTGLRERQKEARERRIVRAAEALFATRGYRETTIADIARRARLAVGTVYNYFPSKPEILGAILQRETSEILAAGEAIVKAPPDDPVAAIEQLFDAYVALAVNHERALWRELFAAALANPQSLVPLAFEADLRLIDQVRQLLAELQACERLRVGLDPVPAAIALYGVYLTWILAYVAADAMSPADLRAQLRRGLAVVVNGLSPARPPACREGGQT